MSKKYKDAMDQVVLSDDVKNKIIVSAQEARPIHHTEPRRKPFLTRYRLNYAVGIAACLVVFFVGSHYMDTNPSPMLPATNSEDPAITEVIPQADETEDEQSTDSATPATETAQPATTGRASAERAPLLQRLTAVSQPVSQATASNTTAEVADTTETPEATDENIYDPFEDDMEMAASPFPGSPLQEFDADLSAIRAQLGYDFKVPYYIPEGYTLQNVQLNFQSLVELSYTKDTDTLTYRTERTTADISGDYTTYETTDTQLINNISATLKGEGDTCHTATWQDADDACAITSADGLPRDDMIQMIASTNYPQMPEDQPISSEPIDLDQPVA